MGDEWRMRAACRDVEPELFFPISEHGRAFRDQVAAAKRVCAGCPVRGECLDFARAALTHGIAGGLTSEERRRITRRGLRLVEHERSDEIGASRTTLRNRGLRMLSAGTSCAVVAATLGVSERTAHRWAELRSVGGAA
jgi:hypothetical protein